MMGTGLGGSPEGELRGLLSYTCDEEAVGSAFNPQHPSAKKLLRNGFRNGVQ